jgi:hypothetical protein
VSQCPAPFRQIWRPLCSPGKHSDLTSCLRSRCQEETGLKLNRTSCFRPQPDCSSKNDTCPFQKLDEVIARKLAITWQLQLHCPRRQVCPVCRKVSRLWGQGQWVKESAPLWKIMRRHGPCFQRGCCYRVWGFLRDGVGLFQFLLPLKTRKLFPSFHDIWAWKAICSVPF